MGIFDFTKPRVTGAPVDAVTLYKYRVDGVFHDGEFKQPGRVVIELSGNRRADHVGDIIQMTREEAAVVGKTIAVTPVM